MRNRYSSKKRLGVLVSSLALVAVTAMAGVTGTAAWFTANRAKTVTAGTFTAYSPSDSLTITAEGIQGTRVSGGVIKAETGDDSKNVKSVLRDASYDATTGTLYRAFVDTESSDDTKQPTVTGYEAVTSYDTGYTVTSTAEKGNATQGAKIYWALSWKYTFSYSNPNSTYGSALFFDRKESKFSDTNTDNAHPAIAKGFRIAFNFGSDGYFTWTNDADPTTNGQSVDIANPSTFKEHTYIGTTNGKLGEVDYAKNKLLNTATDTTYKRYDDGMVEATAKAKPEYIGTFKKAHDAEKDIDVVNDITVTCTAWFEGTDDNVLTSNAYSTEAISASMTFYVRDLKASA
jgi:hypothetical protein